MNRLCSLFILTLSFSSCMLGPKKECPDIVLPSTYVQEPSLEELASIDVDLSTWWMQFHDPLLTALVEESVQKNFDVLTAIEQIKQTRASITNAASKLLPTLGFFGTPARIKTSNDLIASLSPELPPSIVPTPTSSVRDFFILGFDAGWEIDLFGKNLSAKEQAQYNYQASEERSNQVKLVVIAEVVRLYTEIRSLQQIILITKRKITTFDNLLKLTVDLNNSGLKSAIDIENKIAELNKAKSLEPELEASLQQAICNLAFLLGGELNDYQKRLEKPSKIPQAFGKVPVGLPSELLKRRPDIKEAELNLYAAGSALGKAKADLFPSFALTGAIGNLSRKAHNLFKPRNQFWAVLPTINWSLFQGGRVLAEIEIATSDQKIAAITYEKTVHNALKEVENSLIGYSQTGLRTEDILLEYKAKKKVLDLSQCLFTSGLTDLLNLLNEYETFFTIQNEYVEAKEEAMMKLIALYKALGGSWDTKTSQEPLD